MLDFMKTILFLSLFFISAVYAETVYKTVDENGNVIFTDKPSTGSEEIKLQELQTIQNPNTPTYRPPAKKVEAEEPYQLITITSPANDTGLRSNNGDFTISVSLQPGLKRGHSLVITMDGKEVSNGSSTSVSIKNADRGTHSLGARVIDAKGKALISTASSFSLLRASQ